MRDEWPWPDIDITTIPIGALCEHSLWSPVEGHRLMVWLWQVNTFESKPVFAALNLNNRDADDAIFHWSINPRHDIGVVTLEGT